MTALPGLTPTFPLIDGGPVLVTVEPARTPKLFRSWALTAVAMESHRDAIATMAALRERVMFHHP